MDYIEKNRDFKGVWIPKEIWLNENLTMIEKVILIEIDSLDNEEGCIAGNDYLAKFCQCSNWAVSTAIKKLQQLGYIKIVNFDGRHRVIKSNLKLVQNLNLENPITASGNSNNSIWKTQRQPLEIPKSDSGKSKAINISNNLANNLTYNKNGETSSPVVTKTTSSTKTTTKNDTTDADNYRKRKTIVSTPDPEEGQKKRVSRKDQLVNYVDSLSYSAETKDVLRKWIFQIGLPKGVTVPQLTDMVNNLQTACKEESIVRQSINESYLHNWFGFYPPKTTATKKAEYQPEISCDRADPKNLSKEVF